MNGEVENTNEKKKQVRLAIIGVVSLLLLTLGATFAFFLIDTDNSTSKSQINADIEAIDSIALQKVTENLHVNLKSEDMAMANQNTEYFGDDEADYVKTLDEGMHNLGKLTATGGNGKTKYMCSANAVVTMQVAEDTDMGKFFNEGDAYLYLNAGSLQERIDLSELKESGTRTIPFEIGITSESERQIDGYVEIINTASDQTYLANKTLNIDVTFQDLDCNVGVSKVETYLRSKDTENKLTADKVYGMYRYQGNSIVTKVNTDEDGYFESVDKTDTMNSNYICLGSDCSETSNDMYRIIGITEDGLMKVVKNTPANDSIAWNSDYQTDIKWPKSELYKYLNTEYYNTLPIELKNKIINTTWLYGDVNQNDLLSNPRIMELMGTLQGAGDEGAKKEAATELAKLMATETINLESQNATSKTVGNISLMSVTDYCSSFESDKDLNCMSTTVNADLLGSTETSDFGISWLAPQNEWNEGYGWEWTMSRSGFRSSAYHAWYVLALGPLNNNYVNLERAARPVFYLASDVEISGSGTIGDPFRIGIE